MINLKRCGRKDCPTGQEPKWIPFVHFWAEGYKPGDHPPGEILLGIALCETCMLKAKQDEIVPDGVWEMVTNLYIGLKKEAPSRKYARMVGKLFEQLPMAMQKALLEEKK